MKSKNRVCPAEFAGALDFSLRKLIHNPKKILRPYLCKGMTVLDFGCGPGFFSIEMAHQVGSSGKVVAADLQDGMLDKVREKIRKKSLGNIIELHKCQKDGIGLSINPKKFDFVLLFYVLHEIPNQSSLLKEIKSLLKPDGRILIVEPKFHVSREDFCKTMETVANLGFNVIEQPKIILSRSVIIRLGK